MRRQTSPNKSVCDCVSRCTVCTSNLTICAPQFRYVVALLLPYLIYANRRYKSSNDRRKLMHSFFPTKRGKSWCMFTCSSLCSNIGFLIDGVRYVCGLLWCCGGFFLLVYTSFHYARIAVITVCCSPHNICQLAKRQLFGQTAQE